MSVVSCVPIPDSNSLKETKDGKEYTANYRVVVNDPLDGPAVVRLANGLPALGSTYAFGHDSDTDCYCEERNPSRESGSDKRLVYIVSCTWRTPKDDSKDNQDNNGDPVDDPDDARTQIAISFSQYNEPISDAIWRSNSDNSAIWGRGNNEKGDIVNTAMEPFIPAPERAWAYRVIRLTRTFSVHKQSIDDFCYHVNNDAFQIAAFDRRGAIILLPVKKYELFVNDVQWEEVQWKGKAGPQTGHVYMRATLELWHDWRRTWRKVYISKGRKQRGRAGVDPDPDEPGGVVDMAKWPKGKMRQIADGHGRPVKDPVNLDGDGQAANPDDPPVKMTYSIYDEVPMATLMMLFNAYQAHPLFPP